MSAKFMGSSQTFSSLSLSEPKEMFYLPIYMDNILYDFFDLTSLPWGIYVVMTLEQKIWLWDHFKQWSAMHCCFLLESANQQGYYRLFFDGLAIFYFFSTNSLKEESHIFQAWNFLILFVLLEIMSAWKLEEIRFSKRDNIDQSSFTPQSQYLSC